ncbi:MAG TPA: nucleoside-triphosphatase [Candidatus Methylomirabilis sp.]|jgi:nucleoside-triphosphatase
MATVFLLTGPPGVGKTTLLLQLLRALDVPADGFFTAEIREGDRRAGFAIEDLAGRRAVLAREAGAHDAGGPRVGRYRVDVGALEAVGVAALERALEGTALIAIDEVGKMEACSPRFRAAVERALEAPGGVVVGTVLQGGHPWIDRVKAHPAVTLVRLAAATRAATLEDLAGRVRAALVAAGHACGGGAAAPSSGGAAPRGGLPGGRP